MIKFVIRIGLVVMTIALVVAGIATRPLPEIEDEPLLDLEQAAAAIGVARTAAYQMARSGRFPVEVIKIGGRYRVRNADVRDFLRLNTDEPQAS